MRGAYSLDLRERAVAAYKAGGHTYESIAQLFRVGVATVNRWLSRDRRFGSVERAPRGGGQPRAVDAEGDRFLLELVASEPDLTLAEISERYERKRGVVLATTSVWRALDRLGVTRKKKRSSRPSASRTTPDCSVGISHGSGSKPSRTG